MKHISEGDLRAWLDGELESGEQVTAHLQSCAACKTLHDELAARATFVMSAMEELPLVRVERRPAAVWTWWHWAVPALAMAGLALALLRSPKPIVKIMPQQVAKAANQPFPAAPHDPQPVATHPMVSHRAAVSKKAVAPAEPEQFVALDNEPIESGVVIRVGTESGGFQADVIVGPDGRARAIRILTESDY